MGSLTVLITGAAGFLGRATVAAARSEGHKVIAFVRSPNGLWENDSEVEEVVCDLAAPQAMDLIGKWLVDCDAVIHIAAALSGDDATHARDTIRPTETMLSALAQMRGDNPRPRFVLVSSLSVYGYASLPAGAMLDELTPLEPDPHLRDAYCRAKLAQEVLVRRAVPEHGLTVRVLRPGVIYGPDRLWSARLGIAKGPVVFSIGGKAKLPLTHVTHTARALCRAAERPLVTSDMSSVVERGYLDTINVIENSLPSQTQYLAALRKKGGVMYVLTVPLSIPNSLAKVVSLLGMLSAVFPSKVPGLLRLEALHARFKPLRFSSARLSDRLGDIPAPDFRDAILNSGKDQ